MSNNIKLMYSNWKDLEKSINNCKKCNLCKTRNHIVIGEGDIHTKIMLVAEAPGYDEDQIGKPFVGKAGIILDEVLKKIGIKREEIYISNIVKCRPPSNRTPTDNEIFTCLDYLRNQVILIKPKIIVLLGNVALKSILGKELFITKSRGKWVIKKGIYYLPTWHPAALLRDETKKQDFINDFLLVIEKNKELNN